MPASTDVHGGRTGMPRPIAVGGPARVKAFELLPALIQLVARQESAGGDAAGLAASIRHRLEDISHHSASYYFGPAYRLVPWVALDHPSGDPALRSTILTSVLTPVWESDRQARHTKLCAIM